jgi:uncharacterized membrane protein
MTAGTGCIDVSQAAKFSLVARRNNSLTSSGRYLVFAFVFSVSVGIAAGFAIIGAWLILPFAGLEMLALFLAFREIGRHAGDYERIAIGNNRVRVELCESGQQRDLELSRYWSRVVASRDGRYLALRSHGREWVIGRHRNDEERLELAKDLAKELREGAWGARVLRLIHSNRAGEA